MKINDKDVKDLVTKVSDIHNKTSLIEQHLKTLNGTIEVNRAKIESHSKQISKLEVEDATINAKLWVMLFVGGIVGGIFGSVFGVIIKTSLGV